MAKRESAAKSTSRAKRAKTPPSKLTDHRHEGKRLNNPSGGDIDFDVLPRIRRTYVYDPHLPPTLEWAGKAERDAIQIDGVSLHIHQYVSALDILRAAQRDDIQGALWPELPSSKQLDFYGHEVGWANRLILGDSLIVMNSLLEREQLTGKVQCIYVDPPYGVKFNSNFQSFISKREAKEGDDASLTREPEQIQAYRDTWELGIHSYLTYLRERLSLTRTLLAPSGSVFVQISDENVHHVRELMDELFGRENFVVSIVLKKKGATTPTDPVNDFILWYAKDRAQMKLRTLYEKRAQPEDDPKFNTLIGPDGDLKRVRTLSPEELDRLLRAGYEYARVNYPIVSQDSSSTRSGDFIWKGRAFSCGRNAHWRYDPEKDMPRLARAGRLFDGGGKSLGGIVRWSDWPYVAITNLWDGMHGDQEPLYVVQTNRKAVARCMLLTTDPGDLVLDPTCGSGTTAYVAEQWGRRWITCDTSRVALAIARQRILGARFPYYRLRSTGVKDGFVYERAIRTTLKSIAQNTKLDKCKTREERERLIRESSDYEELYDRPEEDSRRVRVSGPFTIEAIPVASVQPSSADGLEPANTNSKERLSNPPADYITMMIDLVRKTGVRFPNKRHLVLPTLRSIKAPYEYLHAEGESGDGDSNRVAVSFGSQHAPVTPFQVRDAMSKARGYDIVLFIGFGCDPEARRMMEASRGREVHFVHAAPDILVNDLLKTKRTSTLFTVFGSPDVRLRKQRDGQVTVELVGVDLYDPITGNTTHGSGEDVAAWFVDQNYDGRTFCISQALFPGRSIKNPWEKLQKALRGSIDESTFETLRGTESLPFKPGKKIAVNVIDDRGNEVIKLLETSGL